MEEKIYNKLVRDKIPEIIKNDSCIPIIRKLSEEDYIKEFNIITDIKTCIKTVL